MPSIPKPVREIDEPYRDWLHTLPSVVTGEITTPGTDDRRHRVEANHIRKEGHGGLRTKPSDRRALPFIGWLHDLYHQIGRKEFERRFNINLEVEILKHNAMYDRLHRPAPRKVAMKAKLRLHLHVGHCPACGQNHDIPVAKLNRKRMPWKFQCTFKNEWIEVA